MFDDPADSAADLEQPAPTGRAATVAAKLAALRLPLDPEIDYDLESVFPRIDGWGAKGELRRKHKLIAQVEPRLKQMLRPRERVLYVAKGVQYKLVEQYFMGIWANLINQTVFVLTNARLLMINTNTKGRPKHTFWMIYYSQIAQFKPTWHGTVVVGLRDGVTLKFAGFPKRDRKEMPRVFSQALDAYQERGFDPEVSQSRENLCSFCLERVPKDEHTCRSCGAEFWRPRDVALRSLVVPSWGDFVMGHTTLALVELVGYTLLWTWVLFTVADHVGQPDLLVEVLPFVVAAVFFGHVPDAWLTYYIAKKGLHPRRPPDLGWIPETEPALEAGADVELIEP